jgi:hypothetical protein
VQVKRVRQLGEDNRQTHRDACRSRSDQSSQTVEELHWRCQLFDDLREKMRIARPGGDKDLNDDGSTDGSTVKDEHSNQYRKHSARLPDAVKIACADCSTCVNYMKMSQSN